VPHLTLCDKDPRERHARHASISLCACEHFGGCRPRICRAGWMTGGMPALPTGKFKILSNDDMPVVAFALKPDEDRSYDEYDIMERLREYR